MKIELNIIILFIGLVVVEARVLPSRGVLTRSTTTPKRGLGVYGGSTTTIEEYPFLVAIVYEDALGCTGVIVSDSWVITLPTCVADSEPSDLTVVAESSDGVTGVSYAVRNWHTHPKYATSTYYGDYEFALVQIKGTFSWSTKTQAAKLPSAQPAANTVMQVAGWGETSYEGTGGVLKTGNMTWLSRKKCEQLIDADVISTFTPRMGCIYNKGKTTLCEGDWGAPAVRDGVVYGQFFVMVTEDYCTDYASPVGMSDIVPVVSWVKKITGADLEH